MADTPNVRFKGFTDAWEQRKLRDVAGRIYGGGTPKTSVEEYWDGNIPWIQSSNLSEHDLFSVEIQKYITKLGLQKSAAQLVPKNSIAVVSHVGVGKLVIMPFEYTTSQDFISLSELNSNLIFICYAIYKRLQEDLHIVQGSAIKGITKDDLLSKEVMFPSLLEQKKIGNALQNLDHLITLHQRKCDETKELKKYMLQKMFPQSSKKIPEIRFAGFSGDWEERKLGEVTISIKNGYSYKADGNRSHRYKITRIESISTGEINTEKLGSSEDINVSYKLLEGDILFSHINSLPHIANTAIYTANLGEIYHGMNLINIRANKDLVTPQFLIHLLKREDKREWFRIVAKPAVNQCSIAIADVARFPFLMPGIEEQEQIGIFFSKLDHLISLHQRKCDQLKEVKKFMLQNMFPQKG